MYKVDILGMRLHTALSTERQTEVTAVYRSEVDGTLVPPIQTHPHSEHLDNKLYINLLNN